VRIRDITRLEKLRSKKGSLATYRLPGTESTVPIWKDVVKGTQKCAETSVEVLQVRKVGEKGREGTVERWSSLGS